VLIIKVKAHQAGESFYFIKSKNEFHFFIHGVSLYPTKPSTCIFFLTAFCGLNWQQLTDICKYSISGLYNGCGLKSIINLTNSKKKILLMFSSFGFALSVIAQDRVVTGKVTSKEDALLWPGVNIVIKGSTSVQ